MTTGIYTTKWFLQCFIDRVSAGLPTEPELSPVYIWSHMKTRSTTASPLSAAHHASYTRACLFFNQTDSAPPCLT